MRRQAGMIDPAALVAEWRSGQRGWLITIRSGVRIPAPPPGAGNSVGRLFRPHGGQCCSIPCRSTCLGLVTCAVSHAAARPCLIFLPAGVTSVPGLVGAVAPRTVCREFMFPFRSDLIAFLRALPIRCARNRYALAVEIPLQFRSVRRGRILKMAGMGTAMLASEGNPPAPEGAAEVPQALD